MPTKVSSSGQELSEDLVRSWRYDEVKTVLLLDLFKGAAHVGSGSVCGHLLHYVRRRHIPLVWSKLIERWGFAGLTIAIPAGYAILLSPRYIHADRGSSGILAHELAHVVWNSHGFTSSEEEYYCDRVAGRAYREMLLADGLLPGEAELQANAVFSALVQSLPQWAAGRRAKTPRRLLQPWTWFDAARPADIASNVLLGVWINLGIWGNPLWRTKRTLGR